jgi:hypothetical protein
MSVVGAGVGALIAACGQAKPMPITPAHGAPAPDAGPAMVSLPPVEAGPDAGVDRSAAVAETPPAVEPPPCPDGMILVDTSYCPRIDRTCVDDEDNEPNHITICHQYAKAQRCLVPEERRHFCIDEYEYPNRRGAHPPWMVSWYDAQATCALHDKRLCYESEWVAACEGPEKNPFPYGFARDNTKCNIDNAWIDPNLRALYGRDVAARNRELSRLDQSVPSGAMAECTSGFGVHDLTGNFDEWVTAERPHNGKYDKSDWAALKGGAWGHVRNACRPATTSHPPDFTYYFIAFRCCKDAPGAPPFVPPKTLRVPDVEPADRAPIPTPVNPPGRSPQKVGRENRGRAGR